MKCANRTCTVLNFQQRTGSPVFMMFFGLWTMPLIHGQSVGLTPAVVMDALHPPLHSSMIGWSLPVCFNFSCGSLSKQVIEVGTSLNYGHQAPSNIPHCSFQVHNSSDGWLRKKHLGRACDCWKCRCLRCGHHRSSPCKINIMQYYTHYHILPFVINIDPWLTIPQFVDN